MYARMHICTRGFLSLSVWAAAGSLTLDRTRWLTICEPVRPIRPLQNHFLHRLQRATVAGV
jgi:hypothetical protein